jgi:hypothetical protein
MFSIMAIIPQIGNLKTFQSRKNCPTKNVYIPIVLDLVFNYVFVFNNVFISYLFLINFLKRLVYLVTLVITSVLFCYKCAAEDGQKNTTFPRTYIKAMFWKQNYLSMVLEAEGS